MAKAKKHPAPESKVAVIQTCVVNLIQLHKVQTAILHQLTKELHETTSEHKNATLMRK